MAVEVFIGSRITGSGVANPGIITTATPHGLITGDAVTIYGHTGSTPSINAAYTVTVTSPTTFTIPVNVTGAGTGGRYRTWRPVLVDQISGTLTVNGRDVVTMSVYSENGNFRPDVDDDVYIYEESVNIFAGIVRKPIEKGLRGALVPHLETRIECAGYSIFAERRLVNATLEGNLIEFLQALVVYLADAPYNITLHPSQATGPLLSVQVYTYAYLNDVLDGLTELTQGWVWTIDNQRRLRMALPDLGTADAPYDAEDDNGHVIGDVEVEIDPDNYANRVFLKCGVAAGEIMDRVETATTPAGTDLGATTVYGLTPAAISFTEQPTVILVNGAAKTIGAPGTTDNGTPWEWIWQWVSSGAVETMTPRVVHNDAVYGNTADGVSLALWSKGPAFYNIVTDRWPGNLVSHTADGYRYYWGAIVASRDRALPPHTVYVNGAPYPVGQDGTTNEVTGQPWDWVWKDGSPPYLGHRAALTALTGADTVIIYSLAPFEFIVQSPEVGDEPTAEQTARGITELLTEAPNVTDGTAAQAIADSYRVQRELMPKRIKYTTMTADLILPGMVQNVTLSRRNLNQTFFITDVQFLPSGADFLKRTVTAINTEYYQGSWRDTYREWGTGTPVSGSRSGASSGTIGGTGSGPGGGAGGTVYQLASGVESQQGATWVAAGPMLARVNTIARGSTVAKVYVWLSAFAAAVTVQARLVNLSDNSVVGTSAVVTSTTPELKTFAVNLAAGTHVYQLQLLPGSVNTDVRAFAYLE
jgi:hypothetical protein